MRTKLSRAEMLELVNAQSGEQELPDTGYPPLNSHNTENGPAIRRGRFLSVEGVTATPFGIMFWTPVAGQHPPSMRSPGTGAEPGAVDRAGRRVVEASHQPPSARPAARLTSSMSAAPGAGPARSGRGGSGGCAGPAASRRGAGRLHGTFGHPDPPDGPAHGIPPRIRTGVRGSPRVANYTSEKGNR